jgi:ubiquinone/menaquinone biosynthesis C-methylase UbiE
VTPDREPQHARDHYSYRHYASRQVAESFDALRFGGPIGGYLADCQAAILHEAFAPLAGRTILDVGTGTGRAAVELAQGGADVFGVDASAEMLDVARARAFDAGVSLRLGQADAHELPFDDGSVDGAVSLRVLMHAIDWRQCLSELCRVSRWRVVVDFPAACSAAAIESVARRLAARAGRPVESYRVMREAEVRRVLAGAGFRVMHVRRQFVLPIVLHRAVGSLPVTRSVEGALAAAGLLRALGSPVTMVAER